jgi:Ser/Thr protein kinase RdoA (MazF antagonist)
MSARFLMRALAPSFTNVQRRHGPFALHLTDFHQSNIFVNEEWSIASLVDLGWIVPYLQRCLLYRIG